MTNARDMPAMKISGRAHFTATTDTAVPTSAHDPCLPLPCSTGFAATARMGAPFSARMRLVPRTVCRFRHTKHGACECCAEFGTSMPMAAPFPARKVSFHPSRADVGTPCRFRHNAGPQSARHGFTSYRIRHDQPASIDLMESDARDEGLRTAALASASTWTASASLCGGSFQSGIFGADVGVTPTWSGPRSNTGSRQEFGAD